MIGKVQDMMTAAIVLGAADKVSSDDAAVSTQHANANHGLVSGLSQAESVHQMQQMDQVNTQAQKGVRCIYL